MRTRPRAPVLAGALIAASVGLAATAAAPAAAATTYTITDLGSLGQGESDASAVNAAGEVTGYSYLSTLVPTPECPPVYGNTKKTCVEHPWHAFLYSNGQMSDLGTLGGHISVGSAINRSGWVVGASTTSSGGSDAFLWNGGKKMIDLGGLAPLAGSAGSWATGINDSGQVVGRYGTGDVEHAFSYSNGTMTGLPEPSFTNGTGCEAMSINNTGQIGGVCDDTSSNTHLVLWQNGAVSDLGILVSPGTEPPGIQALSINNTGQIAGTVFVNGASEGFEYSHGTITNLGSFLAASINDNGVMVGGSSIDNGGTVQDLNTLIPAGSGYQIQYATAINNTGQIVANTTSSHALLLTPG